LALDTFPYNGTTTTCEAMWMGVPVVSVAGDSHAGRVGTSLLNNVALAELLAGDVAAYIALAIELANDADRLVELRGTMRERLRRSPIMDGAAIAQRIESAYRRMWQAWCSR
jgi:protein O-GlcNAc transferase